MTTTVLTCALLGGCWSAPEPPRASLVGLRLTDGAPEFWAGRDCAGVGAVEVQAEGPAGSQSWTASAGGGGGAFETLVLGVPPAGFTSTDPTPDWTAADEVSVTVRDPDGLTYHRSTWQLEEIAESAGHEGQWLTTTGRWVGQDEVDELADQGLQAPMCGSAG